ncbi:exported hypothetical protein [Candidatus Sulfobium mesophilum]|uniref:CARDB domain-containing protein n=1 Tax=Candidatus Sulfobium mesophilum TaxID=2016548 RepID=A0A2U3QEN9_9BACT|nr:exported hypothetical protein [Candidatus Sulfobium mesophilum]
MKKILAVLVFVISCSFLPSSGMALNESPVYVSHTFTGYTEGADTVTVNFTLHVENHGSASLYNVTLSSVSLFIPSEGVNLHLGDIGASGAIDVSFSLVSPSPLPVPIAELKRLPLFWAGEGMDAGGNFIEFPAESQGGAL